MWQVWTRATKYGKLPSELLKVKDEVVAWMVDSAITWFGITIENTLSERVKVGFGQNVRDKPKYTLALLLRDEYRLIPPPPALEESSNPFAELASWIGRSRGLIKRWVYVAPTEDGEKTDG
jgi:hypothetical protein